MTVASFADEATLDVAEATFFPNDPKEDFILENILFFGELRALAVASFIAFVAFAIS
jgi:hypothetical protein